MSFIYCNWVRFIFSLFVTFSFFGATCAQSGAWEKLNKQGEELYYASEYEKAHAVFLKALPLAQKEFGKNHASYAMACDNLGFIYMVMGNYDKSEPLLLESKSIREKLLGKIHPDYAMTCVNLADLYKSIGEYPKAELLYREAVDVFKKNYSDSSHEYALAINNLAGLYFFIGNYMQTKLLYSKAREIWRAVLGEDSPEYATSCSNLGALFQQLGEYSKAEALYKEARNLQERIVGKNDLGYATSCNNLGDLYREQENYFKAEPLYLEAMEIRGRVLGETHPEYIQSLSNTGLLYTEMGQYAKAEYLLMEARKDYAKISKSTPDYANSCSQLAGLYRLLGNYSKTEELFIEAREIFGSVLGKNHSDYAQVCNDFAGFYRSQKEFAKAELLYLEAKKIRAEIYGTGHLSYGATCNNLALVYFDKGDYAKAEPLYLESFEIIKKIYHKDDVSFGRNRNNLAMLYKMQGNYAAAEPLFIEAKVNWEKSLGKKHPDYALVCNNLGSFYSDQSKYEQAEPLLNEAKEIQLAQIEQNFQALSEKEQQLYYQSLKSYFNSYTSFAIKYYSKKKSIAGELYNLRLMTKGLIFRSSQKTRLKILESGDTSLVNQYESLKTQRNYLAKVYRMSIDDKTKKNIDEKELEEKANSLEKELTRQTAKYNIRGLDDEKRTTWQDVHGKLKKKEAAIEIIRMQQKSDTIYVALLLKANTTDGPELIMLEPATSIEGRGLRYYRNCIQNLVDDKNSYNVFWKQLAGKLKGVKKVYFSADGVYHQISLSTLKNPASGRFLNDELSIQIVGSTRDLMNPPRVTTSTSAVLFGFPDYKGDNNTNQDGNDRGYTSVISANEWTTDSTRYFDIGTGSVPALPGTATEVNSINQLLQSNNVDRKLFIGKQASEQQIKSLKNPKIVHIATHGFFLPVMSNTDSRQFQLTQNPLLRSGLLLSGCEKTMKGAAVGLGEDDGILTAYEAMNLFLDETDLVVLSACETGLGELQNGEGVFGLQRAFQQAGGRSILISLWKVDDKTTQLLMTTFYKEYLKSGNRIQSFITAQKTVRASYPQPYYWGAFVMVGE